MSRTSMDMTRGSLKKQILFFSIPLMLSNLLQVLFNMSDIAVIGQFAGAMSLGAVGSTTTLISMYTGFLIGLSGGVQCADGALIRGEEPGKTWFRRRYIRRFLSAWWSD